MMVTVILQERMLDIFFLAVNIVYASVGSLGAEQTRYYADT